MDWEGNLPKYYIVMSTTTGEFFADLQEGAKLQAAGLPNGVDIIVSDAKGNDTVQAELISQALSDSDTMGILTVDGSNTTMCAAIQSAIEAEIPVVSFDFIGDACVPDSHILASQFDTEIASLVLEQAFQDLGTNLTVGYVNDLHYNPLIRRNEVWEKYKTRYGWKEVFFVKNAANFSSAEALQNAIERAIYASAPARIDFIYSPWDYLSQNTLVALNATKSSNYSDSNATAAWDGTEPNTISVYGADINTADIKSIVQKGSEWRATAGASPDAIGALLIRIVALAAANETSEITREETTGQVKIPSTLITQAFLRDQDISNMSELEAAKPELVLPDLMQACWICSPFRSCQNPEEEGPSSSGSVHHHTGTAITVTMVSLLLASITAWYC